MHRVTLSIGKVPVFTGEGPCRNPKCLFFNSFLRGFMESQVEVEISRREIHILLCCCIGSGSEGQAISCSTLLALLVRSRMPRFSMGGGSPKAAARPTASGTVVSLRDLVARTHPPVTSISTKGRIVYLFGTSQKYPCQKFILAGESGDEDDSDGVRVLCKLNHPAPIAVKLDDMLAIGGAECRLTWKRNGVVPESVVAGKVADVELALNFSGGKRKRAGVECLGGKFGLNKSIAASGKEGLFCFFTPVKTGQIDHRTVCGKQFSVKDGVVKEKGGKRQA